MDTSFNGSLSCTDLVTKLLYSPLTITYSNAEFMRDNNKKASEQIKYKKKPYTITTVIITDYTMTKKSASNSITT